MRYKHQDVEVQVRQTDKLEVWKDSDGRPHLLPAGTYMALYPDGKEAPVPTEQFSTLIPVEEQA